MGISNERTVRIVLAGVGLGCFVLLLALEVVTESDELEWPDVLVDALGILLLIGASVGVALLAQRMQRQHEEKMTLLRDLETARAEATAGAPRSARTSSVSRRAWTSSSRTGA
jgi:hypothetical protein